MEKLERTNARFCAKYVKFIGAGFTSRKRVWENLIVNGEEFTFSRKMWNVYNVGDVVYIAKRIPTSKYQDQKWEVHQIILPETYWSYESYSKLTPKEKRIRPYKPYAQTWFGSKAYIVDKL